LVYGRATSNGAPGLREEMSRDTSLQAHWPKENPNETDKFFQIIDARDGKTTGSVFLATGKYSFIPEYWNAAGDWLVIGDNKHRVLLYSVTSGLAARKWFGDWPELSSSGRFLAFESGRGHLLVYDLKTLQKTGEYYFAEPVVAKLFSGDDRRLAILLGDQTIFQLEVSGAGEAAAPNKK